MIAVALLIPESQRPGARPGSTSPGGVLSTARAGAARIRHDRGPDPRLDATPSCSARSRSAAALLAAFVLVERRREAPDDRPAAVSPSTASPGARRPARIASFALFGLLFILPAVPAVVLGHGALGVGLRLLPLIGGLFAGAPLGERLGRLLSTRVPVAAGLLIAACGLAARRDHRRRLRLRRSWPPGSP